MNLSLIKRKLSVDLLSFFHISLGGVLQLTFSLKIYANFQLYFDQEFLSILMMNYSILFSSP